MDPENDVDSGVDSLRADLEAAMNGTASADAGADSAPPQSGADSAAPAAGDQPDTTTAQRGRDESGRFVAGKPDGNAQRADATAKPAGEQEKPKQAGQDKPAGETATAQADPTKAAPPPGWSVEAKAAFGALPEPVKAAIAKREVEVNQGLAKLQEYKGLDSYVDLARKSGTTLPQVLERYVAAEQTLEKNPVQGLKWLCKNYGVDPRQLVDGAAPPADPERGGQPRQDFRDPRVDQLVRNFSEMQMRPIQQQIVDFWNDPKNMYAENVAEDMVALINGGRATTLADAYEKACWARPDIRALLIKQQNEEQERTAREKANAAASNARAAAKSVTGSPLAGASTTPDLSDLPLREQLERAVYGNA